MKKFMYLIVACATIACLASCGKSVKITMSNTDCEYTADVESWDDIPDFFSVVPGSYVIKQEKDGLHLNVEVIINKKVDLSNYYCEGLDCEIGANSDEQLVVNGKPVVFSAVNQAEAYNAIKDAEEGSKVEIEFQLIDTDAAIDEILKALNTESKIYEITLDLDEETSSLSDGMDEEDEEEEDDDVDDVDNDFDSSLKAFEECVDAYIEGMNKVKKGEIPDISDYAKFMEQASMIQGDLINSQSDLSAAQLKEYTRICAKFEKALE